MVKKLGDLLKDARGVAEDLKEKAAKTAEAVKGGVAEALGDFTKDKEVIAFPTYGYNTGGGWAIPLRVWVSKARRLPVSDDAISFDEVTHIFRRDMGDLSEAEVAVLRSRIKHFVADDDSGETVTVKFDGDPDDQTHTLPEKTDPNGLIEHTLPISDGKARQLLEAQGSTSGWLTFTATAEGFEGKGRVRLIEPRGLSLVSDIDDTVKITEVPAGKLTVLRNVFVRDPYEAAPGMVKRYQALGGDVTFHYVSGSPWQLYKILGDYLVGSAGYPEGTFHMKSVRKNLLRARESWEDFKNLVAGSEGILDQKVEQISEIFEHFPEREFILVGDSGEKDPVVFDRIRKKFPGRVRKIFIRDVIDERNDASSTRLQGMAVIDPEGNVVRDVEPLGFGV